jgi:hypothetical protein
MNQKIVFIKLTLVATILLSATCFISCEKYTYDPPKLDPNVLISFQNDIAPIFTGNCTGCHGGAIDPDLREGKAFNSLTNGGYLNTTTPESSRLYQQVVSAGHSARTSDIQKQKILAWIKQGALNN